MSDQRLNKFVAEALHSGISRERIKETLLQAKWSPDQIDGAMQIWSDIDFPIPIPKPRAQFSARDAAMYLVMFAMLYLSVFHFGSIIFQIIDRVLPDALDYSSRRYGSAVRFSTASLIVAFPVFMFLATRIHKNLIKDPAQRSSGVRKWLTYLTLAIAGCVIVGDLIALLYNLLMGELSMRFFLKALTVGAISGAVFYYYLTCMRLDDEALKR